MQRTEIETLWNEMSHTLNEKQKRQYAATLAKTYGYGGATIIHEITGLALNTITRGKKELTLTPTEHKTKRIRKPGGGPKCAEEKYPKIHKHIKQIIDDNTYGSPEKVLTWTTQSLRSITQKLDKQYGEKVTHVTVSTILQTRGYSKQANQKMLQVGEPHPDRNAQFEHINQTAKDFITEGQPVISVDTKKKENIGNFKNNGQEYRRCRDPRKVLDHDFPFEALGKVAPYGVYCQNDNTGFVNVGVSGRDTADFAVESIARWWFCVGKHTFLDAKKLLITCDCGGSDGYRVKLWKYRLSELAKRIGLDIYVCHFPPGTFKWNKVEHRLFCYISRNWQGKPLVDVETVVSLIGSTRTSAGLRVICQRDDTVYRTAQTVSDEEFKRIPLSRIAPFENWNYILLTESFSQVIT
jgi:hypothetical protein